MQVIAESLPISSSGHIVLMHKMMHIFFLYDPIMINTWAFDYFLQGVSAFVFLFYFFSSWWQLIVQRPLQISTLFSHDVWIKNIMPVILFGIAADGITFLLWLLNIDQIINVPLFIGFMITAGILWSSQFPVEKKDVQIWSVRNGFIVGFMQGCALLPGISRFGATFTALRWLGYRNHDAFSISFLIQWPLIVAGSLVGYKALSDLVAIQEIISLQFMILTLISAVIAYGLLYGMQKIIDKNLFWKFSYYMIIPISIAILT